MANSDSDVHVSYEDQQKINEYSRLFTKHNNIKNALKEKQNDVKNLEEAAEELSLVDDADKIPYLVGEIFICRSLKETLESLEKTKEKKENELKKLQEDSDTFESKIKELKTYLYSKFGSNIYLESDS